MSSVQGPVLTARYISAPTSFTSSPDAFGLRRSTSAGSPPSTPSANIIDAASALAASLAALGLDAKPSIPVEPQSSSMPWVPPMTGANAIAVGPRSKPAAQNTGPCTGASGMTTPDFPSSLNQPASDIAAERGISHLPYPFLSATSSQPAQSATQLPSWLTSTSGSCVDDSNGGLGTSAISAFDTWCSNFKNTNNSTAENSSALATNGSAFPPARASAFPPARASAFPPANVNPSNTYASPNNTHFFTNTSAFGPVNSCSRAFTTPNHTFPSDASSFGLRSTPSMAPQNSALQNMSWTALQSLPWMARDDDAMDTSPDDPDAMDTSDDGEIVPGFDFLAHRHPLRAFYNPDAWQPIASTYHQSPFVQHQPSPLTYSQPPLPYHPSSLVYNPFVPAAPPAPPQPTNSNAYDTLRQLDDSVAAVYAPPPPREVSTYSPAYESLFGDIHPRQRSTESIPTPQSSSFVDELIRRHKPAPVPMKKLKSVSPFPPVPRPIVQKWEDAIAEQVARARGVHARETKRPETEKASAPAQVKPERRRMPPCMVPARTWKALDNMKREKEREEKEKAAAAAKENEKESSLSEKTRQCDLTKLGSRLLSAAFQVQVPWVWMTSWP